MAYFRTKTHFKYVLYVYKWGAAVAQHKSDEKINANPKITVRSGVGGGLSTKQQKSIKPKDPGFAPQRSGNPQKVLSVNYYRN
jgi:hypothetical protein